MDISCRDEALFRRCSSLPWKKQHRTPAATLEQGPAVISEEPIGEIPFWMAIEWWENGDKSMVVFFGPPYFRTKPEMWSLPLTHFNPTMTPCRILPNLGIFFCLVKSPWTNWIWSNSHGNSNSHVMSSRNSRQKANAFGNKGSSASS